MPQYRSARREQRNSHARRKSFATRRIRHEYDVSVVRQLGSTMVNLDRISTTFKYDAMPWSSQIEEACQSLDRELEAEGDEVLVAIARLSRISITAADIARRAVDDPTAAKHAALSIEPLRMTLEALESSVKPGVLKYSKRNQKADYMVLTMCRRSYGTFILR